MHTRVPRLLAVVDVGLLLSVSAIGGQTVITPPNNKYTPAQDLELGQKAAGEVEQQLPILRDEAVTSSRRGVPQGDRLDRDRTMTSVEARPGASVSASNAKYRS